MTEGSQSRRPIRLPADDYLAGEPFLLTVCTAHRQPVFEGATAAEAVLMTMVDAHRNTGAELWCGVVMRDHVHMVLSAAAGKSPLDTGSCFKRLSTLALQRLGWSGTLWQRRIHDEGIRNRWDGSIPCVVRYVLENPVRKGYVADIWDWPYSVVERDGRLWRGGNGRMRLVE